MCDSHATFIDRMWFGTKESYFWAILVWKTRHSHLILFSRGVSEVSPVKGLVPQKGGYIINLQKLGFGRFSDWLRLVKDLTFSLTVAIALSHPSDATPAFQPSPQMGHSLSTSVVHLEGRSVPVGWWCLFICNSSNKELLFLCKTYSTVSFFYTSGGVNLA